MSIIYFIRHAQAGTRDNYDRLSALGQQQAQLLGDYFAAHGIRFSAVVAGAMQRQRHTAELVLQGLSNAGIATPAVQVDERWNEFSLLSVYQSYIPRLIAESAEFARDYQEMQEVLQQDPHAVRGATGRCDAAVIIAWMQNRYPEFGGESWLNFKGRIVNRCAAMEDGGNERLVAVFTSATPIAISTSHALELKDEKLLSILGVIANTSVTVMRKTGDDLRLFSFNSTPHLNDANRTYR
ncbi:MAG: histidine phosphatase family protein [Acidobacteria bacterium]|nr:histidine phosphatase family protein [Acidobacteriota bacterium]